MIKEENWYTQAFQYVFHISIWTKINIHARLIYAKPQYVSPSFIKICDVADKMDINVDKIYLELSKLNLKLANFIPGRPHQIMAGPVIMAPWETLI